VLLRRASVFGGSDRWIRPEGREATVWKDPNVRCGFSFFMFVFLPGRFEYVYTMSN
jgi:hypothetical protein